MEELRLLICIIWAIVVICILYWIRTSRHILLRMIHYDPSYLNDSPHTTDKDFIIQAVKANPECYLLLMPEFKKDLNIIYQTLNTQVISKTVESEISLYFPHNNNQLRMCRYMLDARETPKKYTTPGDVMFRYK